MFTFLTFSFGSWRSSSRHTRSRTISASLGPRPWPTQRRRCAASVVAQFQKVGFRPRNLFRQCSSLKTRAVPLRERACSSFFCPGRLEDSDRKKRGEPLDRGGCGLPVRDRAPCRRGVPRFRVAARAGTSQATLLAIFRAMGTAFR